MGSQAVGLNEVGGVTKGAQQTIDARSNDAQNARNTASTGDMLAGKNFGPASKAQHANWLSQAAAGNFKAQHSAEYADKKAMGEKQAVQGHDEAAQTYGTAASQGESTASSLNRAL